MLSHRWFTGIITVVLTCLAKCRHWARRPMRCCPCSTRHQASTTAPPWGQETGRHRHLTLHPHQRRALETSRTCHLERQLPQSGPCWHASSLRSTKTTRIYEDFDRPHQHGLPAKNSMSLRLLDIVFWLLCFFPPLFFFCLVVLFVSFVWPEASAVCAYLT